MKKLVLIGYMGCGKSTIAKKLSEKLKIPVFDLDEIIEKNQGISVSKIFETKGELFFRKLEHGFFKEFLWSNVQMILSTGGGTPCYYDNHLLLKGDGVVSIYLKGSVETLFERLQNEKESRPMIARLGDADAKEFIAKHVFERSFYYNQATKVVVIDSKSVAEVVEEIVDFLA